MTPRQLDALTHFVGERHRRRLADILKIQAIAASGDNAAVNKELRRLSEG